MSRHIPDDEFDRRLRDVLRSRALSITPDVDAIDRIHAGARRRQRRQRAAVSGSAALAVIAVAAVGITLRPTHHNGSQLAGGPSSSSPSAISSTASGAPSPVPSTVAPTTSNKFTATAPAVTTPGTIPAGGAPPAGFVPISVTAVNSNTYWVLGHAPCASGSCTALAKTTDGGKTFAEVGAPPSTLVPDAIGTNDVFGTDTISDVRFVDGNNGWAYGGGLWQTTDGGTHWASVTLPGPVQQLAVASGRAWAIVLAGAPSPSGAIYDVYSATYPNGSWVKADSAGEFGPSEPMLAVQGNAAAVLGTDAATGAQRPVSVTGGSTSFTPLPTSLPCTGGTGASLSATIGALWLACPSWTGTIGGAYFSPDFGAAWTVASANLDVRAQRVAIGAVDAKSAIVGIAGKLVRIGSDGSSGNVSQPAVPASTGWSFVGFTNAHDGFAIPVVNGTRQLWRTTDGGAHWSVVKF